MYTCELENLCKTKSRIEIFDTLKYQAYNNKVHFFILYFSFLNFLKFDVVYYENDSVGVCRCVL